MKRLLPAGTFGLFLICLVVPLLAARNEKTAWWPPEVEQALGRAGKRRAELVKALERVPVAQRTGMAFLIANMPDRDLRTLGADFLLENVALAYRARDLVPWGKSIPEEVFLNDVLPYANLDETRETWRKAMMELCLPLVKGCRTAAEAAQKLNATVFAKLKVRYSTARKKANQSPKESIDQGLASCTGLSVLLSDACRSVCVPARLAGTPLWANKRGNHTWVEVWDGKWHFTGAAEPDPNGLGRGWFVHDAAQAKKDDPVHAIYAASFRRTKIHFPLVWDLKNREVPAENVTERYTAKVSPAAAGRVRVQFRVHEAGTRKRLALPVRVEERNERREVCRGVSRGTAADLNDFLAFELLPHRDYVVRVGNPVRAQKAFRTGAVKEMLVEVEVPAAGPGLTAEQARAAEKAARGYFEATPERRAAWKDDETFARLLTENEEAVRAVVWKAYREAAIHAETKKDLQANQVRYGTHRAPYVVRKVGKKPEGGWPLFIAMHGGGGVPRKINDGQWQVMQRYYRDHPGESGYLYLALRAPDDTWNGFYTDHVPPLVANLIRQFVLFGEADPDRVHLMGYSHGGYGAFYVGPKIPGRFAAVHASAAAPTDGTISARTLRNTRFTFMIGEKDTAYGRAERCKRFASEVEKLRRENKGDYPVKMEFIKGHGHGGLPDRDKIKEMIGHHRDPVPRRLTWDLTDAVNRHFFWLSADKPRPGQSIDAKVADNTVTVTTSRDVGRFSLGLDRRLVRYGRPLKVTVNGKAREIALRPSLRTLCESLVERGDPRLAYTCKVVFE